jgi:hypothetical protein
MVWAQNQAVRGNLQLAKYRARYMSGVSIASVRHDAGNGGNDFLRRLKIGADIREQSFGFLRIKASGNGRPAHGSAHPDLLSRSPLCSSLLLCGYGFESLTTERHRGTQRNSGLPLTHSTMPGIARRSSPRARSPPGQRTQLPHASALNVICPDHSWISNYSKGFCVSARRKVSEIR